MLSRRRLKNPPRFASPSSSAPVGCGASSPVSNSSCQVRATRTRRIGTPGGRGVPTSAVLRSGGLRRLDGVVALGHQDLWIAAAGHEARCARVLERLVVAAARVRRAGLLLPRLPALRVLHLLAAIVVGLFPVAKLGCRHTHDDLVVTAEQHGVLAGAA